MASDLYIIFTSRNEGVIYSVNESNLENIKAELNEMVIEYGNGMVYEDDLLSEELYYYSRIEDKISVYMEKVKVSFTTVNLAEEHWLLEKQVGLHNS